MSAGHKHHFQKCTPKNNMDGWVCTNPLDKDNGYCGKDAVKGCEADGDAYCAKHGPAKKKAKKAAKKVAKKTAKKTKKSKRK